MAQTQDAKKAKIQQILVPIDFSETAHNAFEYALHIAEMLDAELILLHVYYEMPVDLSYMPADLVKALQEQNLGKAQELLKKYLDEVKAKVKKDVSASSLLRSGHAAAQIVEVANELDADLIIMGTQGGDSPAERILGSITAEVIRRANSPVLAIPAEAAFRPIEKVMYALSMEANDPVVIDQLAALTEVLGATLFCTNIQVEGVEWKGIEMSYVRELEKLEKQGKLALSIHQEEDVMKGLRHFIEDRDIDIIAMKTHQDPISILEHSKSLTRKMVLESQIPVLAIQDN